MRRLKAGSHGEHFVDPVPLHRPPPFELGIEREHDVVEALACVLQFFARERNIAGSWNPPVSASTKSTPCSRSSTRARASTNYCDVLGIISFAPDQTGNRGLHKVDLNPLVHAALLRPE
jgi:hypothetical protein